jgi:hypothetical protein
MAKSFLGIHKWKIVFSMRTPYHDKTELELEANLETVHFVPWSQD